MNSFPIPNIDCPIATVAVRQDRILVVDDELAMREFIELSLRTGGFEHFAFAGDGREVLLLARDTQPHLIIMDVIMPRMSGLRALRLLKENADTAKIPVIITSGFEFENLADHSKDQADLLLPKPFTPTQIVAEVNRLLRQA